MTDVFNRFLLTSDPYITHLGRRRNSRKLKKKNSEGNQNFITRVKLRYRRWRNRRQKWRRRRRWKWRRKRR